VSNQGVGRENLDSKALEPPEKSGEGEASTVDSGFQDLRRKNVEKITKHLFSIDYRWFSSPKPLF
jgi:hypothetical protein